MGVGGGKADFPSEVGSLERVWANEGGKHAADITQGERQSMPASLPLLLPRPLAPFRPSQSEGHEGPADSAVCIAEGQRGNPAPRRPAASLLAPLSRSFRCVVPLQSSAFSSVLFIVFFCSFSSSSLAFLSRLAKGKARGWSIRRPHIQQESVRFAWTQTGAQTRRQRETGAPSLPPAWCAVSIRGLSESAWQTTGERGQTTERRTSSQRTRMHNKRTDGQ
jgi:hypothetical protein